MKFAAFCDLIFFHFIPAGTRDLVQPRNWARIFGVPELDELAEYHWVPTESVVTARRPRPSARVVSPARRRPVAR